MVQRQEHDNARRTVMLHLRARNGPVLLEMVADAFGAEFEDATIVLTGRAIECSMASLLFSNSVSGNDDDGRVSESMVSGISSLTTSTLIVPSVVAVAGRRIAFTDRRVSFTGRDVAVAGRGVGFTKFQSIADDNAVPLTREFIPISAPASLNSVSLGIEEGAKSPKEVELRGLFGRGL
jgi:hypothetical protein